MRLAVYRMALETTPNFGATSWIFQLSIVLIVGQTGYGTITTTTTGNFTRAVIYNPPIQLYDYKMMNDLNAFLLDLKNSLEPPKVIIFSSADSHFYMNHIDLHVFQPGTPVFNATYNEYLVGLDVSIVTLLRTLPTIFIGEINGFATGAGNEFAVQLDMRFAGPKTRLGAFEVGVGVIHANGGIQHLTKLIGPGRAAEFLLTASDVDVKLAETYGWVNRAFDSPEELKCEVEKIAARIGLFPAAALNGTKVGIRAGGPTAGSLQADLATVARLAEMAETQALFSMFIELSKNQTRGSFEIGLDATVAQLYE